MPGIVPSALHVFDHLILIITLRHRSYEETEAQRSETSSPGSHSCQVTEPDFKARQAGSKPERIHHPPLHSKWWCRLEEGEGAQVSRPGLSSQRLMQHCQTGGHLKATQAKENKHMPPYTVT